LNIPKLLRWRSFTPLIIVLIACSAACSFTFFLTSASLEAVEVPLRDPRGELIVLFSSSSKVPQTGTISLNLAEKLRSVKGVKAVSPEVLAPVEVEGRPAFLRGIYPFEFAVIEDMRIDLPGEEDWVLVGFKLGKMLGVREGDVLQIKGLIVNKTISLKVVGIIEGPGLLSDELVASLALGQELRALSKDQVTLIRVRVDPIAFNPEDLEELVPTSSSGQSLLEKFATLLHPASVKASQPLSYISSTESLVEKEVGTSKILIWSLVLVVVFSSSLAVYNGVEWVLEEMRVTLSLLRALGLTQVQMKRWLSLLFALISVLSAPAGYLTGYLLFKFLSDRGILRLMFHTLAPSTGIDALITSMVAVASITLVSLTVNLRSYQEV